MSRQPWTSRGRRPPSAPRLRRTRRCGGTIVDGSCPQDRRGCDCPLAAGAAASLVAFALSRTVGLFGFTETGWQPTPYAMISVIAEIVTVLLVAVTAVRQRTGSGAPDHMSARPETRSELPWPSGRSRHKTLRYPLLRRHQCGPCVHRRSSFLARSRTCLRLKAP